MDKLAVSLGRLDDALRETLVQLREQAAAAVRHGQYDEARKAAEFAEYLDKVLLEVRGRREDYWKSAQARGQGQPRRQTYAVGTKHPARRHDQHERSQAAATKPSSRDGVPKTPQSAYYLPVLEAIDELGGAAEARKVIDLVYEKMKDKLLPADLAQTSCGSERFSKNVRWARQHMVVAGWLDRNAGHGVWALTELGKQILAKAKTGHGIPNPKEFVRGPEDIRTL